MHVYHILISPDEIDLRGSYILTVPAPDVFTAAMRAGSMVTNYPATYPQERRPGKSGVVWHVISIMDDNERDYTDAKLFSNVDTMDRIRITTDIESRKD